jgi:adenosylcobyric acid synthase
MNGRTLMVMGTSSNVGKSILVTALCRILAQQGYRVAPFKAQNIALNAGVTLEGHEMARSTIVQAEAAGLTPHIDMNPVLIKPEGNRGSQLVLDGRPQGRIDAGNWQSMRAVLQTHVTAAFDRLRSDYDLIVLEGAGSPAEINLKKDDFVNMGMARYAGAPVLLVGDIDQGGVFAALVGTMVLLEPVERALVKGFVINKFRGDPELLGEGLEMLRERAFNTPTLGVIPFLPDIGVAAEDSVILDQDRAPSPAGTRPGVAIAVIRFPHLSNFDDFDPLDAEPGVEVLFVDRAQELGTPSAVILPGTKLTLNDLAWLRQTGLAERILRLAAARIPVVGICGGYQMLGRNLRDPDGVEAQAGAEARGLDLLPLDTSFAGTKRIVRVEATLAATLGPFAALEGTPVEGYEIHMGRSRHAEPRPSPFCVIGNRSDGAVAAEGTVWGTYLHGIFDNDVLRHCWLRSLDWQGHGHRFDRQQAYDRLAKHVRAHLDLEALEQIIAAG